MDAKATQCTGPEKGWHELNHVPIPVTFFTVSAENVRIGPLKSSLSDSDCGAARDYREVEDCERAKIVR